MAWRDSLVQGATAVWKGAVVAAPYVKKTAMFTYRCLLEVGYQSACQTVNRETATDEQRENAKRIIERYEEREREMRQREEEEEKRRQRG